uniref:Putative secreted protein n=1 Tax=Ixodes ricinus TaxID=34613 RepID=V5HBQ0_IXORI
MRSTTLFLMAVSLLVTANLVWTCWSGNNGYKTQADKYCDKPCSINENWRLVLVHGAKYHGVPGDERYDK